MTWEQIQELCLSLPGAVEDSHWEDHLVFKVAGKIFLMTGVEPESRYSLKCTEAAFHDLTQRPGIIPAPYLARSHWVQVDPTACTLQADEVGELVRQSYELVVAKLPKRVQRTLLE